MPDDKPVQDTLTPEQKAWVDGELVKTRDAAVTEFKTAAEAERAKSIPEKYELKFADGSVLDPTADTEEIAAYLKAQGFSTEQAKAHIAHLDKVAKGLVERQKTGLQEGLTQAAVKWAEQTKADKELGGEKFVATEANVRRAMEKFAPEGSAFRTMLNETGYGNHPEFVRFVNAIGKAMAEDSTILGNSGSSGAPAKKSAAEILFGETANQ